MSGSGLFAIFFVVVLGLIVLGMVQSVLRQQQIGELRRSGTRVAATVTNILHERVQASAGTAPNPTTGAPGFAPTYRDDWFVEAEWRDPATGATHHFKSERLSRADAERYAAGSPITVLIDPNDPGSYYVEIAR
ncbi:MAG TPA: DUF3592 domain-containing protein [Ktedonobacterales bacterium]|nr:DUF3592 domain-containing protein [Ktedonobacterales bacterium]